jgi:hypothetical protein
MDLNKLDDVQRTAFESEFAAAVLGNVNGEHMLVDLDSALTDAENIRAHLRGYFFAGVMGYKDGQCSAKCEPSPEAVLVMAQASWSFAQYVADRLRPKNTSDWLESLWRLPDNRN